VVDAVSTPPEQADWYAEKLVYLPHSYHIASQPVAEDNSTCDNFVKPNGWVVLGNLNGNGRMGFTAAQLWASVLVCAPQTVLMLRRVALFLLHVSTWMLT
jgi:predicted O-linked N-acetylglucosamine transferase (SPINDLY family)